MQPNYSLHYILLGNTPYACILHDKEVKIVCFITAIEINVHNFNHSKFNAQTYKQHTNKQTNKQTHTSYITPQTHLNLVARLAGPNCR